MSAPLFHDRVLIGICTFRRPELAATLASLAALTPCGLPVAVAIADNDAQPSARDLVEGIAADHPLEISYLHAPQANISIARNALLDHARATGARLLVYLDDDETVEPDWLMHLVAAWRDADAGAVLGPVRAHYRPDAPGWMDRARAIPATCLSTWPTRRRDGCRSTRSGAVRAARTVPFLPVFWPLAGKSPLRPWLSCTKPCHRTARALPGCCGAAIGWVRRMPA